MRRVLVSLEKSKEFERFSSVDNEKNEKNGNFSSNFELFL